MKKLSLKDRIRVAAEELEEARPEEKVDASVDVTEAIQQENDMAEIDADIVQYKADQNALEELEEVEEVLVEQAVENNEKLQDGENVNPEDVQASQEAIRYAKRRCGYSLEEIKRDCHISYEGMKESPYTMLQISQEGIKDALKWVWAKIKEFFKKIVDFFKNIWKKILAFFGSYNAKIDLVIKKLEGAKWDSIGKLREAQIATANKLITPALSVVTRGSLTELQKLLSYSDMVKNMKNLNTFSVNVSSMHRTIHEGLLQVVKGYQTSLGNAAELIYNKGDKASKEEIKMAEDVVKKLSKELDDYNSRIIAGFEKDILKSNASAANSAKMWNALGCYLGIDPNSGSVYSACGNSARAMSVDLTTSNEITILNDPSKGFDYSNIGRSELLDTIKAIRGYSESLKNFDIERQVKEVTKNIEVMEKEANSKEAVVTEGILEAYTNNARVIMGEGFSFPATQAMHKLLSRLTSASVKTANQIMMDYSKNIKSALDFCVYLGSIATGKNDEE